MENPFDLRSSRESSKLDDRSIINRLDAHMETHSEQGWRSHEMVEVRGRILAEPQRILTMPFKQCFQDFVRQNPDLDVGVITLFKIKDKWLNHYRQPRKTDRQIACCKGCQPLNMMMEAVKNTKAGSTAFPHTTDEFLIEFQICSIEELQSRYQRELTPEQLIKKRELCVWSECQHCSKDKMVEKLQNHIDSCIEMYEFDGDEVFNYPVYCEETKAFVNQSVIYKEEAAELLATASYQGKGTATGEKVLNHRNRLIDSSNYIENLFDQVSNGQKAIIVYFDHAMGISKEWGKELQAQHFQRQTLPFQGFCVNFAMEKIDENDEVHYDLQKTQTFYIAEANTKDNHIYTLSCLEDVLKVHCTDVNYAETFKNAETLLLIGDGCEKQNWHKNIFLGIETMMKHFQNPENQTEILLPNVKRIEFMKTVSGHGKNQLDAAFGTLKQAVRQETQKSGGVRYNPENPSGGFENAQDVLRLLKTHRLFNTQYENRPDKPIDRKGFELVQRNTRYFNEIIVKKKYRKFRH